MAENVNILNTEILSENWGVLKKVEFEYKIKSGETLNQTREVYDRGNGAAILLYNKENKNVILTKQFRIPAFLNGHSSGMMIEACAGLLDDDHPEEAIKRETEEETGYKISQLKKVFEVYMSPGSVTEKLHFYIAAYTEDMKVSEGGGVDHENENIEVLEMAFDEAMEMIDSGEINDAKTILLIQYLRLKGIL
jgi:nudix-type nucleoside diphosphatase (YffH/AdpP family)